MMTRIEKRSCQPERQTQKHGIAARTGALYASLWMGLLGIVLLASERSAAGGEVSFRSEVEAVISKAGCKAGTGHGNKYGKGGFKRALPGQEPGMGLPGPTPGGMARRG